VRNRHIIHVSFLLIVLFSGTVWQSCIVFDFLFHQEAIISEECINKDKPKKASFVPFFGTYYEKANYDRNSEIFTDTGGSSWYSDIGFKLNVKNILLTSNVQFAFENNLNGTNQLVPKARLIIGLNYLLK
jgi:hypothetical protein